MLTIHWSICRLFIRSFVVPPITSNTPLLFITSTTATDSAVTTVVICGQAAVLFDCVRTLLRLLLLRLLPASHSVAAADFSQHHLCYLCAISRQEMLAWSGPIASHSHREGETHSWWSSLRSRHSWDLAGTRRPLTTTTSTATNTATRFVTWCHRAHQLCCDGNDDARGRTDYRSIPDKGQCYLYSMSNELLHFDSHRQREKMSERTEGAKRKNKAKKRHRIWIEWGPDCNSIAVIFDYCHS